MNESMRIDSHKLHLHPERVLNWLNGEDIAPIYMEISPSGLCNHRCIFCGLDFMGYQNRFLPTDILCHRLEEMSVAGVKAIMYAGEGEPLLHQDIAKISTVTKKVGMDVAFTTNGVHLTQKLAQELLPITSWIKVSCNAGTPETYAAIHRTSLQDFNKVLLNLELAIKMRQELKSQCTIGMQMILLPENQGEALTLAATASNIGVDYLILKPYSQHPKRINRKYQDIQYHEYTELNEALEKFNTSKFKVIFRNETIQQTSKTKTYTHCQALPFWCYVDSSGQIWACLDHIGNNKFLSGNLLEQDFKEFLSSEKRKTCLQWCLNNHPMSSCRTTCRMHNINNYLWELKHPHPHVNFI